MTAPKFPSFKCPRCGAESFNANDIAHSYCGRCHDYTGTPKTGIAAVDTCLTEYDRRCSDAYKSPPERKAWLREHRTQCFQLVTQNPAQAEKVILAFLAKLDAEN